MKRGTGPRVSGSDDAHADAGKANALKRFDVSRETIERLDIYETLLIKWSKVKNLVAPSTFFGLWTRHFLDSLQLLPIAREHGAALRWIDMGAGAGFPGLVLAIALAEQPAAKVFLIESDHRKCAFLREVSRETGLQTEVIHERIENVVGNLETVDCITARALAPLAKLVEYALPQLEKGALGLFPKGQHIDDELTNTTIFSKFDLSFVPSITETKSRITIVRQQR